MNPYTMAELHALVDALPVGATIDVVCEQREARAVSIRLTYGRAYKATKVSIGRALVIHDNVGSEKYLMLGEMSPHHLPCDHHAHRRGETAIFLPA